MTGAINLALWLSYLVTIALYAVAFGSYAGTFFAGGHGPWLRHLLISLGIVVPALINLLNAEFVSRSETAIVMLKLTLLTVVIVAGAPHVNLAAVEPVTWPTPMNLIVGGMVIFVAFEGFELIANAGADVRNPSYTLPRGFYGSVIFTTILYVLIAVVTVGSVPLEVIDRSKDYALAVAARSSLGQVGFTIVAISAVLANFGSLASIAIMGSAGFLLIFAVVNASAWKLGKTIDASRLISGAGAIACAAALIVLLQQTYQTTPDACYVFLGIVGFALLFELLYPRIVGRKLKINSLGPQSK